MGPNHRNALTPPSGQFDKSQAVLRSVLESPLGVAIFALDREYRYLAFNQNHAATMQDTWDASVRLGASKLELIKRDDDRRRARANFDRALAGESFTLLEVYGDENLGRRHYEDVYSPIRDDAGQVIGLTVYLTDITERSRAERELALYRTKLEELVERRTTELEAAHAQLLHVQKLESMGVLAGGIAHDFNNLLAVILGRAELASAHVPVGSAARAHLDIVQGTALEARMLTKQLLGYSGKGKFMVQPVDLNQLVESMMQLLRASISRSVTLFYELAPVSPCAEADVTQLRQILLNLVTNAAEAIGDRVGSVTVRTRTLDVDAAFIAQARPQPRVAPGRYTCVEVEDTGCGMDPRIRDKLFDPFFTTKFAGRGLGLAAVLGIVSSHRGGITLHSVMGEGSVFGVLLPACAEDVAWPLEKRRSQAHDDPRPASILVVDDEKAVRAMTRVALESLGHEVLEAGSGRQACAVFGLHKNRIDLVLLDLTMPEMNGEQTLRALQDIDPNVRALIATGYGEEDVREQFQSDQLAGFLAKPFSQDELLKAVSAALELSPWPQR